MSSNLPILYRDQFVSRDEHRRKRESRRFWGRAILATSIAFGSLGIIFVVATRPEKEAAATEIPTTTTAPLAAQWSDNPTPTTAPVPEAVATTAPPQWITPRVTIPGWDGLGKLITDGKHYKTRVLPGELGVSVIGVEGDLSTAATVVVEGVSYRVRFRGAVAANNLDGVADRRPIVPVVVLVSLQPGDSRPYVEATP